MKNRFERNTALSLVIISVLFVTACTKKSDGANSFGSGTSAAVSPVSTPATPVGGQGTAASPASPQPDANYPLTNYTDITSGNQVMFLYYALSGMPPDYAKIAESYSKDYRSTSDAFKQQDILKVLTQKIDASISSAKTQRYITWVIQPSFIGHYDFSKKSFPLNAPIQKGVTEYVTDNSKYRIGFTNGSDFSELPVSDENLAKKIENSVSKSESFTIKIYGFAQSTDPYNDSVNILITHVSLLAQDGAILASNPEK